MKIGGLFALWRAGIRNVCSRRFKATAFVGLRLIGLSACGAWFGRLSERYYVTARG